MTGVDAIGALLIVWGTSILITAAIYWASSFLDRVPPYEKAEDDQDLHS